jgi:biopolymer transport protein TolQ
VSSGFLASVAQSGLLGQIIVAFLLMVSVYSWAIIIYKAGAIRRAGARSQDFLLQFRDDPNGMIRHFADRQKFEPSPLSAVFEAGLTELALVADAQARGGDLRLSLVQVDGLERSLERTIAEQVLDLRSQLIVLATTSGIAPFIGLFGTVWGIMEAFTAMTVTGSASISSVAPGVAAALTTTVAGLAVAIPALAGYNYIMNRVRSLTVQMENFSSEFLSTVERNFGDR